jgi:hypothetical protein
MSVKLVAFLMQRGGCTAIMIPYGTNASKGTPMATCCLPWQDVDKQMPCTVLKVSRYAIMSAHIRVVSIVVISTPYNWCKYGLTYVVVVRSCMDELPEQQSELSESRPR